MTSFIIAAFLTVAAALVGAYLLDRRRYGLRSLLRRTVVVHTQDGKSFRGVLVGEHVDCLVLEQAELLDEKMTVGGRTVLLRPNISWAQDVTGFSRPGAGADPSERFEVARDEVS